jgi:pyruvate, water dikinase
MYSEMSGEKRDVPDDNNKGWRIALALLRNTDPNLFIRISRKMMNYLGWRGVPEARQLLRRYVENRDPEAFGESNLPQEKESLERFFHLSEETFRIASANLTDEEILGRIQKWTSEDRSSASVKVLENVYASLNDVLESMRRIKRIMPEGIDLPRATANSVRVALIRRFFTEQLEFINIAKKYLDLEDFFDLVGRIVFPPDSHGKLGGKTAGLFLASRVLRQACRRVKAIGTVKKPKTWYITSDTLLVFTQYNNLEEVERAEVQGHRGGPPGVPPPRPGLQELHLPPGDRQGPVRGPRRFRGRAPHRPQLEPARGPAGDGLRRQVQEPLPGQPGRQEGAARGPPRRRGRGLRLHLQPRPHPVPGGAGPARLLRGDGHHDPGRRRPQGREVLLPGLRRRRLQPQRVPLVAAHPARGRPAPPRAGPGTRAVDRLSDDYPILVAPGKPNLRVNVSTDEVIRYSPTKIDVIDLEKNCFTTLPIRDVLREVGTDYPALNRVLSIYRDGLLQRPMGLATDFGEGRSS